MKVDPELIRGISSQADDDMFEKTRNGVEVSSKNQVKQLDLQWSGNNAVLRAWSEPEGLPSLQHLETVNIIVPEDTVVSNTIWASNQSLNRHYFNLKANLDKLLFRP